MRLTRADDLGETELLTLGSELPEEQWILLLHLLQWSQQRLQGDEHTWEGRGGEDDSVIMGLVLAFPIPVPLSVGWKMPCFLMMESSSLWNS